ncbi:MAG: surface-adhesin E family protein [Burkholderiales bacterium]
MRKAILAMLLAGVCGSAIAEWVAIAGNNDVFIIYADPSSILKTNTGVKIWHLTDYKTAQFDSLVGKAYLSGKTQTEYDCQGKQTRRLYSVFYSGNEGDGQAVSSGTASPETQWIPVIPGSVGEAMFKYACGKILMAR